MRHFDQKPFLWIAVNDSITWPGLNGLFRRRDVDGARAYLQNLANHGVNGLRLMLEYAHRDGRYFERQAGTFNPLMVRLWDDLFELCEEVGIRVLLAPWDNFWMSRRWHRHPYNAANGGPAHEPGDFFTHEETIAAVEHRLRFVAARWGSALGAWICSTKSTRTGAARPKSKAKCWGAGSRAIREEEQKAWGWTRPQTVSIFGPEPEGGYDQLIFNHPELDFSSTHIYHRDAIDKPLDTIAPRPVDGRTGRATAWNAHRRIGHLRTRSTGRSRCLTTRRSTCPSRLTTSMSAT